MPTVSLRSFITTGDFGNVQGGWMREELEQELGPPEDFDVGSRKHPYPTIWKYGDIEFFFKQYCRDGPLQMVFFDGFDIPRGWGQLKIEPWIIHGGLTCQEAESLFSDEGIEYQLESSINPENTNLVTATGVLLEFTVREVDEYSPGVGLVSVSKRFTGPAKSK